VRWRLMRPGQGWRIMWSLFALLRICVLSMGAFARVDLTGYNRFAGGAREALS